MDYSQFLLTVLAIVIGSLIASYLDFLLLEDLRIRRTLLYSAYGGGLYG